MTYEIKSILPMENEREVLVEVHHWHTTGAHASKKAPDLVEHHLIELPRRYYPKQDVMGQYVRADGTLEPPFRENDEGDWEQWTPEYMDLDYVWLEIDDAPLIEQALDQRAKQVREKQEKGLDIFAGSALPPIATGKKLAKLSHTAKRPSVQKLVGKSKWV